MVKCHTQKIVLYKSDTHRAVADVYPEGGGVVRWEGKANQRWVNRLTETKNVSGMAEMLSKAGKLCPECGGIFPNTTCQCKKGDSV
jgi:hypothetical protein